LLQRTVKSARALQQRFRVFPEFLELFSVKQRAFTRLTLRAFDKVLFGQGKEIFTLCATAAPSLLIGRRVDIHQNKSVL
jgi:hypothetical protein